MLACHAPYGASWCSERAALKKEHAHCFCDDFQIKPYRPAVDILQIIVNAHLDKLAGIAAPAVAVHLSQSRYAGLDVMPERVVLDQLRPCRVMTNGVWPRTHE